MIETLEQCPDKFYYFNNGLSAICTRIEYVPEHREKGLFIKCANFQIINGAQTTACIGTYKDAAKLKDVRVLLRITQTEDIKKEQKGLNRSIILYNNSQTVIKASDFRSNDKVQVFLEEKLKEYSYRGTKQHKSLVYVRKRKKIGKSVEKIYINLETLARVLHAFA
ncbi:AIPR family protein [Candidatus Bathyarchaeota archaeon]|nr:AIPR family protein [Candidatus Bathyarchaeota archaeon]